jgi:squalene-hopene/tetraprenyl-beta-curcumene cyclase
MALLGSSLVLLPSTRAQSNDAEVAHQPTSTWTEVQQNGLAFLLKAQKDGAWQVPAGRGGKLVADPGMSAICLAALATKPKSKRTTQEASILDKGIDFLLASQKKSPDGAFSTRVPSYVTCAAIMALVRADTGRKDVKSALAKAQRYLLAIQNIEQAGTRVGSRDYGSTGYQAGSRGDLSNTQMVIEGLRATGLDPEHEALQKALVFLRRVQNLPGKGGYSGKQTLEIGGEKKSARVEPGSDGGATYYPGTSPAGYDETESGTYIPRSYGSMTYSLLKCYILCGLPKNDPRLKSALEWCKSNYTIDHNPGIKPSLGEAARFQGLYYYYVTLARALSLAEVGKIDGHDWRAELRTKLSSLQREDGSWLNEKNGRWWENNPLLCTAYALLALSDSTAAKPTK